MGCWVWNGYLTPEGYAHHRISRPGNPQYMHRVSWEAVNGPVPTGMVIDHMCRERSCVNPDHLRCVTPRVNALENNHGITAKNAAQSRCPKCSGIYASDYKGGRICRPCQSVRVNAWRRAKKARLQATIGAARVP